MLFVKTTRLPRLPRFNPAPGIDSEPRVVPPVESATVIADASTSWATTCANKLLRRRRSHIG